MKSTLQISPADKSKLHSQAFVRQYLSDFWKTIIPGIGDPHSHMVRELLLATENPYHNLKVHNFFAYDELAGKTRRTGNWFRPIQSAFYAALI